MPKSSVGAPTNYWSKQKASYGDGWKDLAKRSKASQGNVCQHCGAKSSPNNPLHSHHITSLSPRNSSFANTESNLTTLCKDCHSLEHKRKLR